MFRNGFQPARWFNALKLRECVKHYIEADMSIIPVHWPIFDENGRARCSCYRAYQCGRSRGKHPRVREWERWADWSPQRCADLLPFGMPINLGVVTGHGHLEFLDFDVDDGKPGLETLAMLADEGDLCDPIVMRTGSGGLQLGYQFSGAITTDTNVLPGMDFRAGRKSGNGRAQSVVPPSLHQCGQRYVWSESAFDDNGKLRLPPKMPPWLQERLADAQRAKNPPRPPRRLYTGPTLSHDDQLERLRGALQVIPSEDYNTWLRVGMALHHSLGDAGFDTWVDWSASAANFDEPSCDRAWRSFARRCSRPLTIASVFHEAKQHGWQPPRPRRARPIWRPRCWRGHSCRY